MKRTIKGIALILAVALLGGCTLAREDRTEPKDEFVGVAIRLEKMMTDEDMEAFNAQYETYNAAVEQWLSGHSDFETDAEGRVLLPEEITSLCPEGDKDGRTCELGEDDQYLISVCDTLEDGETGQSLDSTDWFCDLKMNCRVGDDEENIALEATVYLTEDFGQENEEGSWRLDRVYRRADGSLYAAAGTAWMSGMIDGSALELSENESMTVSDGRSMSRALSVKVTVCVRGTAERLTLCEMSADNRELARREIDLSAARQGDMTETVSKETDWVLIEEEGKESYVRTALTFEDGSADYQVFLPDPNEPMVAQMVTVTVKRP